MTPTHSETDFKSQYLRAQLTLFIKKLGYNSHCVHIPWQLSHFHFSYKGIPTTTENMKKKIKSEFTINNPIPSFHNINFSNNCNFHHSSLPSQFFLRKINKFTMTTAMTWGYRALCWRGVRVCRMYSRIWTGGWWHGLTTMMWVFQMMTHMPLLQHWTMRRCCVVTTAIS